MCTVQCPSVNMERMCKIYVSQPSVICLRMLIAMLVAYYVRNSCLCYYFADTYQDADEKKEYNQHNCRNCICTFKHKWNSYSQRRQSQLTKINVLLVEISAVLANMAFHFVGLSFFNYIFSSYTCWSPSDLELFIENLNIIQNTLFYRILSLVQDQTTNQHGHLLKMFLKNERPTEMSTRCNLLCQIVNVSKIYWIECLERSIQTILLFTNSSNYAF